MGSDYIIMKKLEEMENILFDISEKLGIKDDYDIEEEVVDEKIDHNNSVEQY